MYIYIHSGGCYNFIFISILKKWNSYDQYIKIGTFYSKIRSQRFMEKYKDKYCILKDNIFLILIC